MSSKLQNLPATTSVASSDILYVVTTPGSSPTDNKITVANFQNSTLNRFYADTVSGTINGSNVTFTVSNTILTALVLFLNGVPLQPSVDFTTSGTTITMTVAPDAGLSGTPFWLLHT